MKELALENPQTSHLCIGLLKHLLMYTVRHWTSTKVCIALLVRNCNTHFLVKTVYLDDLLLIFKQLGSNLNMPCEFCVVHWQCMYMLTLCLLKVQIRYISNIKYLNS